MHDNCRKALYFCLSKSFDRCDCRAWWIVAATSLKLKHNFICIFFRISIVNCSIMDYIRGMLVYWGKKIVWSDTKIIYSCFIQSLYIFSPTNVWSSSSGLQLISAFLPTIFIWNEIILRQIIRIKFFDCNTCFNIEICNCN